MADKIAEITPQEEDKALRASALVQELLEKKDKDERYDPELIQQYLDLGLSSKQAIDILFKRPPRIIGKNGRVITPFFIREIPPTPQEVEYSKREIKISPDIIKNPDIAQLVESYIRMMQQYLPRNRVADGFRLHEHERRVWQAEIEALLKSIDQGGGKTGIQTDYRGEFRERWNNNKYSRSRMSPASSAILAIRDLINEDPQATSISEGFGQILDRWKQWVNLTRERGIPSKTSLDYADPLEDNPHHLDRKANIVSQLAVDVIDLFCPQPPNP